MRRLALGLAWAALAVAAEAAEVRVADRAGIANALRTAAPGTTILIAPGTYPGGFHADGLQGEPDRPITLRAAEPANPPIIEGSANAFHLSRFAHLILRDLIIRGQNGNGLNLDDGGSIDQPSHHLRIERVLVMDIGPTGNADGLKLSGVDDFSIVDCTIERWGDGGSGIDLVGCHRGLIEGTTLRSASDRGDSGVQAKGGSRDVSIRRCRFEDAGSRAINLGGSTGLAFFRPPSPGHEAADLLVEDCTFVGSDAAVAFVGVDGATVRHNTIVRPRRYAFRVLQETRAPGFVPCRNARIEANLIVHDPDWAGPFNIGPDTAPESFVVRGNAWGRLNGGTERPPTDLPFQEVDRATGVEPEFINIGQGDYRLVPNSPLRAFGAR